MDAALDATGPAAQPPVIRKPARKPAWRGLLLGILSGALGAVLAVGFIRLLGEDAAGSGDTAALRAAFGAWTGAVVALAALAAGWFAILAHEAGHVAGARLARFRFHLLVAGPLRIWRDPATQRIRAVLNRARDAAAARAYLAEVPEKTISVTPFDRLRAEAAVALAEGDAAAARERVERARAVLPADDAFRRALLDQMTEAAAVAERATA